MTAKARIEDPRWREVLQNELHKPYVKDLASYVALERSGPYSIFPREEDQFNAFNETPFDQVKVVIVGQDPYHGPGQAHGLSFSVLPGVRPPPSLKNIFKELESDLGFPPPKQGCLLSWAKQGVFLLNATLTVRQSSPKSHHGKGWELFTDAVLRELAMNRKGLVFLLWGKLAQEKGAFLKEINHEHLILQAPHPSPYSASSGFFGCRHFSQANAFLESRGEKPINWDLASA